jgi:hypothetical protein
MHGDARMKKTKRINVGPVHRSTDTFFVLNGATVDEERRLVTGYMDSGEPNNQGYLLDYDTTKPYIVQYVKAFEHRTGGDSKGALREMHQPRVVGKIVSITLEDDTKRVLVTVRVDDDDAWKKVLAKDYTAFSGHWTIVGKMWADKEASAKYGRQIFRYTGDPVEVSLLDVPRVPGCEFQRIENGITEDEMSEILERLKAVQTRLEAVTNGVCIGNQMASDFEDLVWIFKAVQSEEFHEGQDQSKAEALRAGLLALKPAIQAYLIAQLDELLPDSGEEDDMDEDYGAAFRDLEAEFPEAAYNGMTEAGLASILNGDLPGHPFHGNQHVSGSGQASASSKAHAATLHANEKGSKSAHSRAAAAHTKAAAHHNEKGNTKAAAFHERAAKAHASIASKLNGDVEEQANGHTTTTTQREKSMTQEEIQAITNGIGTAFAAALKPLEEKLDALKVAPAPIAPVANGNGLPVPQLGSVLVTHDPIPPVTPTLSKVTNGSVRDVIDAIPADERNPTTIAEALKAAGLLGA